MTAQASPSRPTRQINIQRDTVLHFLLEHGLLIALIVEIIIFSVAKPELFLSERNMFTILRISATTGITVAFYTMAIIAGQIDLSTVQVGALGAVVFSWLFAVKEWSLGLSFVLGLLLCAVIGLANGYFVTRIRLPAIIATLATGSLATGFAFAIVQANSTTGLIRLARPPLRSIVAAEVFGIPIVVIVMFVAYIFAYIVLNHTKIGAHLYALGGNPQAARLNGIQSNWLIRAVLVGTVTSAYIAAIIVSGRSLSAGALTSVGSTGNALVGPLVATVFAGVGLSGGAGRVERTLIGVLFLSVLGVGMAILSTPPWFRLMVEGLSFVFAILLDSIRVRLATR